MKRTLILLIVLIALGAGILIFFLNSSSLESPNNPINLNNSNNSNNLDNSTTPETKTFVLTGENFKFVMNGQDNPKITVNEGDTVRIEFTSTSGFHDWTLDEFGAATERVNDPESSFVEFVADEKGTFEYYCSVGQHRANGMEGMFIVE